MTIRKILEDAHTELNGHKEAYREGSQMLTLGKIKGIEICLEEAKKALSKENPRRKPAKKAS
jgi:hypothetical protein